MPSADQLATRAWTGSGDADRQAVAGASAARYGLLLAGAGLLLPDGLICELVPAADVYPIPGAPPRLRGLMQRYGRPLPVYGIAPAAQRRYEALRVLIIGEGRDAAALEIELAPEPVQLLAPCSPTPTRPSAYPPGALMQAWSCRGRDEPFWEFDLVRLCALLGDLR